MNERRLRYEDVLQMHRGLPVFFESPSFGNNGDRLIEQGSRHVHQKYGLRYTATPERARLILVRGNGAMLEQDPALLTIVKRHAERYPTVPLCMEPSTFHYRSLQLRHLLPEREAKTYLFARDWHSLRYLEDQRIPGRIEIGIDHDMALALRGSDFLHALASRTSDKVLLVERLDVEHPLAGRGHRALALALYRSLIPKGIRLITTPLINRVRSRMPGELKRYLSELADQHFPDFAHLPRLYRDIGDVSTTFKEFLEIVATSAATVSTRLHVGILAAMLGKPTVLVVGDYRKIQWVYDYSLRDWANVSLRDMRHDR